MSSLPYFHQPHKAIKEMTARAHYSSAVRLPGGIIKCSGQGGWDENFDFPGSDVSNEEHHRLQVEQAFKNVDEVVRAAGGNGWADVYSVRTYHLNIDFSLSPVVEQFEKWCGADHRPLFTCVGVTKLGDPQMLIEVEVEAYSPQK
ncbi:hypothetical protein JCM6882_007355 [Rhodosporidiobolus microsporus]